MSHNKTGVQVTGELVFSTIQMKGRGQAPSDNSTGQGKRSDSDNVYNAKKTEFIPQLLESRDENSKIKNT